MNQELVSYVKELSLDSENDDNSQTVEQFIDKLQKPVEYKHLLKNFKWKPDECELLDSTLIELGYCCQTEAIDEIKQFLTNSLYEMSARKYNLVFKKYNAKLWNHMEYIESKSEKIDKEYGWLRLSTNPAAIRFMKKNPDKIYWNTAIENTEFVDLLENYPYQILDIALSNRSNYVHVWGYLSANSSAIDFIMEHPKKIIWSEFQRNSAGVEVIKAQLARTDLIFPIDSTLSLNTNSEALEILKKNPDRICWSYLSLNPNPIAIEMLKENFDEIDWEYLSYNPGAINILKENLDKINWHSLSVNYKAINLLKANPYKIDYEMLSYNPGAMDMIFQNLKFIDFDNLLMNPYDFNQDKFDHFNKMRLFPRSGLILKNPRPPNYDVIDPWMPA